MRVSKVLSLLALAGIAGSSPNVAHSQVIRNAPTSTVVAAPGQIVLLVPATYSDADVTNLANTVGATVLSHIPYSPHYYVITVDPVSKLTRPLTRAARGRATTTTSFTSAPVEAAVTAAVTQLNLVAGVSAMPNYAKQVYQTTTTTTTTTTVTPIPTTTLEPNGPLEIDANDPLFFPSVISTSGQQWDMMLINMPRAWAIQTNAVGRTVVVCDLDTGIDPTHPDLEANIQPGGMDFSVLNADPTATPSTTLYDDAGHGSHTAGTMDAVTGNGVGVVGIGGWNRSGVSIKVLPVRLGGDDGWLTSTEIAGLNYAVSLNVDAINMSFGSGPYAAPLSLTNNPEYTAMLAATNAGITLVAAEGNSSVDTGTYPFYPANYPNIIDVSACGPQGELSFYSDYGGNVALTAPGGDDPTFMDPANLVLSTFTRDPTAITNLGLDGYVVSPVTGYETIQGTSMACPHVTGAVGLLIAAGATRNYAQIKAILQATATPLSETPNDAGGNKFGAGLLNVSAALATLTTLQPGFTAQIADVVDNAVAVPVQSTTGPNLGSSGYSLVEGASYTDRGLSYVKPEAPFTIRYVGRSSLIDASGVDHPEYVSLDIAPATAPSSVLRHYVGGAAATTTTFALPALPSSAASPAVVETTTAPGTDVLNLPDGNYSATLNLYNPTTATTSVLGVAFFELTSWTQPSGRSMFASPFLVQSSFVGTLPPELFLFGTNTDFSLARYNAQRLPTDLEYATYSPIANATQNPQAEFVTPTALDGSPLTYLLSSPTASIAPVGLGYWLDLPTDTVLAPTGNVATAAVGVKLFADNGGWNMIGDPYTYPVLWPSVSILTSTGQSLSLTDAATAGVISPVIVGYAAGEYVYSVAPAGTLNPFNGYWVRAYQDCTMVITPTSTNGKSAHVLSRAPAVVSTTSQFPAMNGWKVRLSAAAGGDRDGENYLGVLRSETLPDQFYSVPKPPTGAGHAYLTFVRAAQTGKTDNYAVDMRKSEALATGGVGTAQQTWTANVSTDKQKTPVTLSWDGIPNVPPGSALYLIDSTTGQRVAMGSRSSYTFTSGAAGSTRAFQIVLDTALSGGPLAIENFHVTSTGPKAGRATSFHFTSNREAQVSAVVTTKSGRLVATLASATRAEAAQDTVVTWNGKNSTGGSVPIGSYFVELTVTTADGEQATVKQLFTSLN